MYDDVLQRFDSNFSINVTEISFNVKILVLTFPFKPVR